MRQYIITDFDTLIEGRECSRDIWRLSQVDPDAFTKNFIPVIRHPINGKIALLIPKGNFWMRDNIKPMISQIVDTYLDYLPIPRRRRIKDFISRFMGQEVRYGELIHKIQYEARLTVRTERFMRNNGWFPNDNQELVEEESLKKFLIK